jgi:hypothetical protein
MLVINKYIHLFIKRQQINFILIIELLDLVSEQQSKNCLAFINIKDIVIIL